MELINRKRIFHDRYEREEIWIAVIRPLNKNWYRLRPNPNRINPKLKYAGEIYSAICEKFQHLYRIYTAIVSRIIGKWIWLDCWRNTHKKCVRSVTRGHPSQHRAI